MAVSFNAVLLLSILIISPHYLEAFTLKRGSPLPPPPPPTTPSPCCGSSFLFRLPSFFSLCGCPGLTNKLGLENKCCKEAPLPTTTLPPPVYPVAKCEPPKCVDRNAQIDEVAKIFKEGGQRIISYTDTAAGPVIYAAERISDGADLIPLALSAGGDFLGKAIAGPLKFFNKLGFTLMTGAISQIVSIPITIGSSVKASTVILQPYMNRLLNGQDKPCCPPSKPSSFSPMETAQVALKPIGILTGATHLALGKMLEFGGSTFRLIGTMSEDVGSTLKNTGSLKVADGVQSVSGFIQKLNSPVLCIDNGTSLHFYEKVVKPDKEKVPTKPVKPTTSYPTTVKLTTVEYPTTPKVSTTPYAPVVVPTTMPVAYEIAEIKPTEKEPPQYPTVLTNDPDVESLDDDEAQS